MAAPALNVTPVTVTGNGPVTFLDAEGNGTQISIPLAALAMVSGTVKIDPSSSWATDTNVLTAANLTLANNLLAELQRAGYLRAAPAAATKPAMVLTATNLGPEGNSITACVPKPVQYSTDPTQSAFSLLGAEKDVYAGLTVNTISSRVGVDPATAQANPGGPPQGVGLVHVKGTPTASTDLPDALPATDVSGTLPVKTGSNTLFTLETRNGLPAGTNVSVTITLDPSGTTFTLTASWSLQVDTISLGPGPNFVETQLQKLAFLFSVSRPASGAYSIPDAALDQPLQFSGGSAGSAANLILYAKQ